MADDKSINQLTNRSIAQSIVRSISRLMQFNASLIQKSLFFFYPGACMTKRLYNVVRDITSRMYMCRFNNDFKVRLQKESLKLFMSMSNLEMAA